MANTGLTKKDIEKLVSALAGKKPAKKSVKKSESGPGFNAADDKELFVAGSFMAADGKMVRVSVHAYKGYAPKVIVEHGERRLHNIPVSLLKGDDGAALLGLMSLAGAFEAPTAATGS
jgi:hypothetical protein